jgi:hypothetical protein
METQELSFKVVKVQGEHDEVIAYAANLLICRAAYQKALFMYPTDHLQMRQGARIIEKSKEE